MIKVLAICTGNVCRSPLAALLLEARLEDVDVSISSAGIGARDGASMTPESIELATSMGVRAARAEAHAARYLTLQQMASADLCLAMAREHRRRVVELDPSRVRTAFTAREFARLTAHVSDADLRSAARAGGETPRDRFAATLAVVASRRGVASPPHAATDDDVVDPFGRDPDVYRQSARELAPALEAVERVVRAALG